MRNAECGSRLAAFRKPPVFYGNRKTFDELALDNDKMAWFIAPFVSS